MRHHADVSTSEEDNSVAITKDACVSSTEKEESHSENAKLKALVKQLESSLAQSKNEIKLLRTSLQRLDPSLLSPTQLYMYTSLGRVEYNCLVSWLSTTSVGRRSASPCPALLPSGETALTFSQTLLLVLMRIRQNLTKDDLAC